MLEIINIILNEISNYPELYVFFSTFFFGDEMVYFFSFLSGQGILALYVVIIFSILGNGSCDIFWYFVARNRIFNKLKKFVESKEGKQNSRLLFRKEGKNILLLLLFSKFLYGTRLLAIFYVAKRVESFKKILIYNSIAVILWVFTISILFWFVGRWTFISFNSMQNLTKMISLSVLIIVLFYFFNKFIVSKIIKKLFNKKD